MRMSITTMSGRSARVCSTASAPSPASPMTSKSGSAAKMPRSPPGAEAPHRRLPTTLPVTRSSSTRRCSTHAELRIGVIDATFASRQRRARAGARASAASKLTGTLRLPGGQIAVALGSVGAYVATTHVAIMGGTGRYAGAHGAVTVHFTPRAVKLQLAVQLITRVMVVAATPCGHRHAGPSTG